MLWWHLTLSSPRRANVFHGERLRRAAVRTIVRISSEFLLLFCVVDDHVHVVVACAPSAVANLRRAIVNALSCLCGERLTSHVQPVESRAHLVRLLTYMVTQPSRHGIDVHLALYSGSCFQDLIGARQVDGFVLHIARELPRMRLAPIYAAAGLPDRPLLPANDPTLRAAGPARIVEASFAALAAGPSPDGRHPSRVRARHLAAHLASGAGVGRSDIAWALELTPQRIGQLLAAPPPSPRLDRAARLQIALELAVAGRTLRAS